MTDIIRINDLTLHLLASIPYAEVPDLKAYEDMAVQKYLNRELADQAILIAYKIDKEKHAIHRFVLHQTPGDSRIMREELISRYPDYSILCVYVFKAGKIARYSKLERWAWK